MGLVQAGTERDVRIVLESYHTRDLNIEEMGMIHLVVFCDKSERQTFTKTFKTSFR